MKPRLIGAAALIAPALIVTACSSSSKSVVPPATSLPGSALIAGSTPAGSAPSESTRAAGGASAAAWCRELKAAGEGIIAVGGTSTAAPAAYKTKLEALVADAPSDIRPDLEVLARIDEKLADGDANAENEISNAAVAGKVQHVVVWLSTNCRGIITDLPTGMPDLPTGLTG